MFTTAYLESCLLPPSTAPLPPPHGAHARTTYGTRCAEAGATHGSRCAGAGRRTARLTLRRGGARVRPPGPNRPGLTPNCTGVGWACSTWGARVWTVGHRHLSFLRGVRRWAHLQLSRLRSIRTFAVEPSAWHPTVGTFAFEPSARHPTVGTSAFDPSARNPTKGKFAFEPSALHPTMGTSAVESSALHRRGPTRPCGLPAHAPRISHAVLPWSLAGLHQ